MKKITSLQAMEKITNGNKAFLEELLIIFIKEAGMQIEKLQSHLSTGNVPELKNTAHKIKSSLLLIGLETYKPLAEDIERNAEKDSQKTTEQVNELISIYKQALEELKSTLQELS